MKQLTEGKVIELESEIEDSDNESELQRPKTVATSCFQTEVQQTTSNLAIKVLDNLASFLTGNQMSGLSKSTLTSMGYVSVLRSVFVSVPSTMVEAIAVEASNTIGAGQHKDFSRHLWNVCISSAIMGSISALVLMTSGAWMRWFVDEADLIVIRNYLVIYSLSLVAKFLFSAQKRLLLSSGYHALPVALKFVEASANIGPLFAIINKEDWPDATKIQIIAGVDLAVSWTALIVTSLIMRFHPAMKQFEYFRTPLFERGWLKSFKQSAKHTLDFGIMYFAESGSFLMQNLLISKLSPELKPIQSVITQYYLAAISFVLGLKKATIVCVGYAHGAHQEQLMKRRENYSLIATGMLGAIVFLGFAFLNKQLMALFNKETTPEFENNGMQMFTCAGTLFLADAVNNAISSTLAGRKHTRSPAVIMATVCAIGLASAALLGYSGKMKEMGVYIGRIVGMLLGTISLAYFYRQVRENAVHGCGSRFFSSVPRQEIEEDSIPSVLITNSR